VIKAVIALLTATAVSLVQAQTPWPSKPIKIIVPLAAGGGSDIATRVVAQTLGEVLGQPVSVDNKVGANGVIGTSEAARAPADGYTVALGSSTTLAANRFLYKNSTIDPFRDFVPLAIVGTIDFAVLVPASSNIHSIQELVAAAKANPGKLSYGFGSSAALICGELFKTVANVDIVKVAYKGSPQALTDLAADRVQLVCDPLGTSMPLIKAGKLRPLAVTGRTRHSLDPTLPTMAEAGLAMEHVTWSGYFVPTRTPPAIVQRLTTELVKIMGRPEVQAKIRETGFVPMQLGGSEFATFHRNDFLRMEKLIKGAGITPE
jgi:tripartite-type tricarboxylate transporter receptor subunit TctC